MWAGLLPLYEELQSRGVEVIYDDRQVSAGIMFSDADLPGVPLRVIVSARNLKQNILEVASRDKRFSEKIAMEHGVETLLQLVNDR